MGKKSVIPTDWVNICLGLRPCNDNEHLYAEKLAGGDTDQSFRVTDRCLQTDYFLKLCPGDAVDRLIDEAHNLNLIAGTQTLRTPAVLDSGLAEGYGFLLLEYLPLTASDTANHKGEFALGAALARMHQSVGTGFGAERDNFIGGTSQSNRRHDNWRDFWLTERLQPQLALAGKNGWADQLEADEPRLRRASAELLQRHQPAPSLLHGDLWRGNAGFLISGEPVVFDPACYFGDRETDIAFTRVFGGFGMAFYKGYESVWPLATDACEREPLYNLYHLLNHLNLFGGSYLESCNRIIRQIFSGSLRSK